jgi:superfamily II DNA or RNA helicase
MDAADALIARKPLLKRRPTGKFVKHDFQREDIARLVELDSSANWSEMGAMKTSTVQWLFQQKLSHIPNPRVLVTTTKTGKGPYFESLWEILPEWEVFSMNTNKINPVIGGEVVPIDVDLPPPNYFRPIVLVSHYHCFTNRACVPRPKKDKKGVNMHNEDGSYIMEIPRCNQLLRNHWDFHIIDEAHRIKNPDAQWTRNLTKVKSVHRHIMTGTGFVNDPSEIWSLLNFLYPKVYTGKWKFREHYCEIETGYGGYQKVVGIKPEREEEFRELVRQFGPRRTMRECFPEIREPIETVVEVDLNSTQQKMYDEITEYLATLDAKGEPLHSPNVLSMLHRQRQITGGTPNKIADFYDEKKERRVVQVELIEPSSKLDATMEIIEGLEWDNERRDQVVVFSNFKDPLKMLQARLTKAGIPHIRLLAEMNEKKRYELWHDVWPEKKHQVFLCTLDLGAESINLTSAHRAIFIDQHWSPAKNKQAIGRVYRPGQTGAVQLIYIRARDTVDYRVLGAVNTKTGWFKQIFGTQDVAGDEGDEEDG